jgi:hypothetical protein
MKKILMNALTKKAARNQKALKNIVLANEMDFRPW